jgi:hypothetical protein
MSSLGGIDGELVAYCRALGNRAVCTAEVGASQVANKADDTSVLALVIPTPAYALQNREHIPYASTRGY